MTTQPILRLDRVSKRFGKIEALRELSLDVERGEILGLIGPNGSGKTTTIRLLLGFYKPDAGTVRVFDLDPRTAFARIGPRIGVMLEQPGLHAQLTAREYLEFYGGLLGMPRPAARRRAEELLDLVELRGRADGRLKTFSKGMRQRTTLARCLMASPELLVLDEPFDGIDAEARRDILLLLPRLALELGTTILVTSHNLAEVERICGRIAIVNQGRIVACDRTDRLLRPQGRERHRTLRIRLAEKIAAELLEDILPSAAYSPEQRELRLQLAGTGVETRDHALRTLLAHAISIESMCEEDVRLEDVYFAYTEDGGGPR